MEQIKKFLTGIEPRDYQIQIYQTCKEKNCLVVLPTGIGKTLVALMLAIDRLTKFPQSKILFLAPTRPLAEQHLNYFKKHLPELFGTMELFTGKVDAEKRKQLWQSADIVFSTPQCVDEKTLIFTEDGPIKISEFFERFKFEKKSYMGREGKVAEISEKVLGFDGKEIRFLEALRAWKLPGEGLIKIKTEICNEILCTRDHPILTINQEGEILWKEACLLNKGDYIASAKEINVEEKTFDILNLLSNSGHLRISDKLLTKELIKKLKANKIKCSDYSKYLYNFMPLKLFLELADKINFNYNISLSVTDNCGKSCPVKIPEQLSPKLAYIIGAIIGDGHISNRQDHGSEVVFSDLDRESVRNEFQKTLKEIFDVQMKNDRKKGLIAYNSALASILVLLGIPAGKKAKHIKVPEYLFFSNKEVVGGFIKGIFDTDGNASEYNVSIASASEKFVNDLKWLFLKIGIAGSVEKRIVNNSIIEGRKIKESEIFTFRFSGRKNLQKFLETSPNMDKCKKLIATLDNTKRPDTRSKEILPVPKLMKKICKINTDKAEYYKFSCLSLDNLKKLSGNLQGKESLRLKELLNLPIRWVKIKEKEEINEKKEVYDLTIKESHNFITNTIISHNCVSNDVKNNLYGLQDVSLLIEDECHRCLKNYAYTYVAEQYLKNAQNARVLGLTASPGVEKSKIKEICKNLGIEDVEVRTRESEDVKHYLQKLEFDVVKLDFPEELNDILKLLRAMYEKKVDELKNRKLLFLPATKKNLLELQHRIMISITRGNKNFNMLSGASACAQTIKLGHALELLQTQTLSSLQAYMQELFEQAAKKKSKAVQQIVKQPEFNQAYVKLIELTARKIEHPKLAKLKEIVQQEIAKNPKAKVIVFAQYRNTLVKICKTMNELQGISAKVFVGQAKKGEEGEETGLSQKEQQEIIREFSSGNINVLCASSIGEEGLDIPEVNAVIFYEPIPSAIRKIQRAGRTARLIKGKLIILLTKKTLDESYYWAAFHKEKRMHSAINSLKEEMNESNNKELKNAEEGKKEAQKKLI